MIKFSGKPALLSQNRRFMPRCSHKKGGFSIAELAIVIAIFSFILVAIYTILDSGLKAWNIGEKRTDLQNNGEIILRRMVHEMSIASQRSLVLDISGHERSAGDIVHEYICFESPVKDGEFKYQKDKFGTPVWHGYIIYYVHEQDTDTDPNGINIPKKLYRRYIDHGERAMPVPVSNIESLLTVPSSPSPEHREIATNVDTFDVTRDGFIVKIKLAYRKAITDRKQEGTNYSISGTANNKGTDYFELQASVEPKN